MYVILRIWRNSSQSLVSNCTRHKTITLIHSCLLLACALSSMTGEQKCPLCSFCRMTDINRNAQMDLQLAWINFYLFYNYWLGNSNRLWYSPDKKLTTPFHKSWEKAKETWKLMYAGNRACQDKIITNSKLRSKKQMYPQTSAGETCSPGKSLSLAADTFVAIGIDRRLFHFK